MQQGGQGSAGQLLPAVFLPLQMPLQTLQQTFQTVEARFLGLQLAVQAACVLPQGAHFVGQRRQEFPLLRQSLFQPVEGRWGDQPLRASPVSGRALAGSSASCLSSCQTRRSVMP